MINLVGAAPPAHDILALPDAHYHWYGKSPRPGRKLGHITVCAADHSTLAARVAAIRAALGPHA
jgi:5-(carboxyamino)imidazole ribonucleotide synthase